MTEKLEKLMSTVNTVIRANAGTRVNGKPASYRTQEYTQDVMHETCRTLHKLGFFLEDIAGLREKHIEAVVRSWHSRGLQNKTMQNQFSRLRIFCRWIGKTGIVSRDGVGVAPYLPEVAPEMLRVSTVAAASRSWSGNGVDVVEAIKAARREDQRFANMMLLGLAFGLRKKEQLRIKPWKADKGDRLDIDGNIAKGGRPRTVIIEEGEYGRFQRWCLDEAKKDCRKYDALGWPELDWKQSENRYYHFVKKLGFTKAIIGVCMHGLRAEYAENMAIVRGLLPPSLGGALDQLPRGEREAITTAVSNLLGHSEIHTIGAYFSSFRMVPRGDGVGQRIGSVLIDSETDTFASVYCNPAVVAGKDGTYRQLTEAERSATVVTVSIERLGRRHAEMGIAQFLQTHESLYSKLADLLNRVGLGRLF